ncbi:MAG: amino acid permease [Blastocatellia bacterium]
MKPPRTELVRGLKLADAISLVAGSIIGTGIFLKSAVMAELLGSPGQVLLAWIAAGLLSLAGALSYAELGGLLPQAGGEYVYLRAAYGDATAFLYGWMRFVAGLSGSIAALAAGFAVFFTALFHLDTPWVTHTIQLFGSEFKWQFGWAQVIAVLLIIIFSAINCAGIVLGGRVQTLLTGSTILSLILISAGIFLFAPGVSWAGLPPEQRTSGLSLPQAFGAAMIAALWAYDGWNNMPMSAGEIERPERNVPRALVYGMAIVLTLYLLINLACFHALPMTEIVTANASLPIASKAVSTFMGTSGNMLVSVIILLAITGALNGTILTGARVPYAMARDGLFPLKIAELHAGTRAPVQAILWQAGWACTLALLGTFDQLTDYAVFAMWLFYILTTLAVFVLRRRRPDATRPYRTLAYPLTPLVFILVGVWLLINTLLVRPLESGIGLTLIGCGLPVYFYFRARRADGAQEASLTFD